MKPGEKISAKNSMVNTARTIFISHSLLPIESVCIRPVVFVKCFSSHHVPQILSTSQPVHRIHAKSTERPYQFIIALSGSQSRSHNICQNTIQISRNYMAASAKMHILTPFESSFVLLFAVSLFLLSHVLEMWSPGLIPRRIC